MNLGDRMKRYERVSDTALSIKTPVIIRVDGKAFHHFTRGYDKPWDGRLIWAMLSAAQALCETIDGARLAYTQSDEISVLVCDWSSLEAQPYLGYRVQKLASIAASIATASFNRKIARADKLALFDARVFNVPMHEVTNYFIWRQQDATRNSIQGLAQANFSHRKLQGKNLDQLQDLLFTEAGINWNDQAAGCKRGWAVTKDGPDMQTPIFSRQRGYIEDIVNQGEL